MPASTPPGALKAEFCVEGRERLESPGPASAERVAQAL